MADYSTKLINVLVSVIIFGALFPIVNTQVTNIGLDNISVAGTTYDFNWVGYLIVLSLLFGLVYLAMRNFKNK